MKLLSLTIIYLAFNFGALSSEIGKTCNYFGVPGTCKGISDCPEANNYDFPQYCEENVVCCAQISQIHVETSSTQRTKKPPSNNRWPTRKPTTASIRDTSTTTSVKPTTTSRGKYEGNVIPRTRVPRSTAAPFLRAQTLNRRRISAEKCEEYRQHSQVCTSWGALIEHSLHRSCHDQCVLGQELIANGIDAKPNEFPHAAALGYKTPKGIYNFKCGGSLISERFILTAAHCIGINSKPSIVRLGTISTARKSLDDRYDYKIKNIIKHPKYRHQDRNDIALIELEEDIKFTNTLRPACLWQKEIPQSEVTVIGWGQLENAGRYSTNLQKVKLDVVDGSQCHNVHKNFHTDSQICALGVGDSCPGDSGGPVEIKLTGSPCVHHIVGVTSFGTACGYGLGAVYEGVSDKLDWIEKIVWPEK